MIYGRVLGLTELERGEPEKDEPERVIVEGFG